ncbi:MAG: sodium/proton-translocating pyrophosphatase, partial [Nitrososphaerota archaeon]
MDPLIFTMVVGLLGAVASVLLIIYVERLPKGSEDFITIWHAIREGASAYLKRQFRTIAFIAAAIAVLILGSFSIFSQLGGVGYGVAMAGSFLLGVSFSLIAAFIAM